MNKKIKDKQFTIIMVLASIFFSIINPKIFIPTIIIFWALSFLPATKNGIYATKTIREFFTEKKETSMRRLQVFSMMVFFAVLSVANPLIFLSSMMTEGLIEALLGTQLLPSGNEGVGIINHMTVVGFFVWIGLSILFYSLLVFNKYKKTEKKLNKGIEFKNFLSMYLTAQILWLPFLLLEIIIISEPTFLLVLAFGGFFVLAPVLMFLKVSIDNRFDTALKEKYP